MNFFKRDFYNRRPNPFGLVLLVIAVMLFATKHQTEAGRQIEMGIFDFIVIAIVLVALAAHTVRLVRYVVMMSKSHTTISRTKKDDKK